MRRWTGALAVLLLAGCGATQNALSSATPTRVATPAPVVERLIVEGDDATRIVDPASGVITTVLPGGVLSPTLDLIVNVALSPQTVVHGVDLTGQTVVDLRLDGNFKLPGSYGPAPSGFSPNGKWLVLVARDPCSPDEVGGAKCLSRFAVIDIARNRVANTIELSSRFTFDAIHNDGAAMYLIEHPKPGATSYNVRFYDLTNRVLKPDIIFDKAAIAQYDPTVGLMDGTFHVSLAPKDGDWSYGLYMRPNGSPFVHALNVPGHYATCIVDLAGSWTKSSRFSMALADDAHFLYVVDAGMGTISVIDALSQKVSRRATFAVRASDGDVTPSAVISHDGTRLYATSTRGIAMLSTSDLTLKGWLAPDLALRSLALRRDGAALYALADDTITVIDPASGRTARLASVPGARALHLAAAN